MAPVTIRNEERSEDIVLDLDEQEIRRAEQDPVYLNELVAQYYAQQDATREIHHEQEFEHRNQESSLFMWNDTAILLLLSLYEEHKEDMCRKRHKVIYENIARQINDVNPSYQVTGGQCQSKINSLKKHYKKIKDHNNRSGNDRVTWPYYEKMEEIFGSTGWAQPVAVASEEGPFTTTTTQQNLNTSQTEPKKRKLESILEKFLAEREDYRKEKLAKKQENFEKFMKLKEEQHKEKMDILKNLCNNINNNNQ